MRHKQDDPLIGETMGQCQIVEKLGEGSMGAVYKARHLSLDRFSALKVLPEELARNTPEAAERFLREARAAAALSHPNIVAIHNVGLADGRRFIEMEYVEGTDLQERLEGGHQLRVKDATEYIRDTAKALRAAHAKNLVHRDIKPANIMVTDEGEVKVMDFGLAKDVRSAEGQLTMDGAIVRTPYYMSPEQCEGEPLDGRADIYSLAATYYFLLTGREPFPGGSVMAILLKHKTQPPPDPRERRPDLPDEAWHIVRRGMAKAPDERYQTCDEMLADLDNVLAATAQAAGMQTLITSRMGTTATGTASQFPAERATSPNNLPIQTTSFVGRPKELAEAKRLLEGTRLLTVTGVGGVGKTRLALQVGADLRNRFHDGVWLVELAALSDPGLVPQALATALDIREQAGRPLLDTLVDRLRARRLLLLLDNCEHLMEASAELADALLKGCPDVQLLVTSREALGLGGEVTWRIPSLPAPDPQHLEAAAGGLTTALTQYEAVQLLIDRAVAAKPGFAVTDENVRAVSRICWRLDGIPLAIELAAARMKVLTAAQIAERLDDRFRLLTGGSRTALPRQRTLRATIDWSHNLLSEKDRVLLRRLSVFAGGWTLEAAEAACAGPGGTQADSDDSLIAESEVLDLLSELVEKSLATAEEQRGEMRYRLLETVRQYATERLTESGEGAALRDRHRDFYLALAEHKWADRGTDFEPLDTEHDNLRAALAWSKSTANGGEMALRLAAALSWFWRERGSLSEGRAHLAEILARADAASRTEARARALSAAGSLALRQGDYPAARRQYEESRAICRELGDKGGVATSLDGLAMLAARQADYPAARVLREEVLAIRRELGQKASVISCLVGLGHVACDQGDYSAARAFHEEALAIGRELQHQSRITAALHALGLVALRQGNYSEARSHYEEALAVERELGSKYGIAASLDVLGMAASAEGDYSAARALHEESLAIRRESGEKSGVAHCLAHLGRLASNEGDHSAARALHEEALAIWRELGERRSIAESLEAFAPVFMAEGQSELAARLLGAADALREATRAPLPPFQRDQYDREVAAVRAALGEETFAAAWAEGRTMATEDAVAWALRERDP